MAFKLGKLPAVPVAWKYRDIFNPAKLTRPPLVFGHVWNSTRIEMLGNDACGDCVWATQAHLQQSFQRGVGRPVTQFSAESVVSDYSAATGYDPKNPEVTDNGSSMAEAARYWRRQGIRDAEGGATKITAYVEIKLRDTEALTQAAFDFGGVALGVQFPKSAADQWDRHLPWTYSRRGTAILGGHAVALLGRNSHANAVIATWDGIVAATPQWIDEYQDEALAFFSLDYLDQRGISPRGYDRTELEKKLASLG